MLRTQEKMKSEHIDIYYNKVSDMYKSEIWSFVNEFGGVAKLAKATGIPRTTIYNSLAEKIGCRCMRNTLKLIEDSLSNFQGKET